MGDKLNQQRDKKQQGSLKENFFVVMRRFKVFSILCSIACVIVIAFFFREVKAGKRNKSIFSPDGFFAVASIKTNSPDEKTNGDNSGNSISVNPDDDANTDPQEDTGDDSDDNQAANNDVGNNSSSSDSGESSNSGDSSESGGNGTTESGGATTAATTEASTEKPDSTTEDTSKDPQPTQSIEVSGSLKTDYCVGQKIDEANELSGLNVVANLISGKKKTLSYGEYTIKTNTKAGFDTSREGTKNLTITYGTSESKASVKVSYGVVQWILTLTLKDNSWTKKLYPDENLEVSITDVVVQEAKNKLESSGGFFAGWATEENGQIVGNKFKMTMPKQTLYQGKEKYNSNEFDLAYVGDKIAIVDYKIKNASTISIPDGIDYMYISRFNETSNYKTLNVPSSIVGTNSYFTFYLWPNLKNINVDSGNQMYSDINGVLYNKSQTILYACPVQKSGSLTIPSSVKELYSAALYGAENLSEIKIASSSKISIGNEALGKLKSNIVIKVPSNLVEKYQSDSEITRYELQDSIVGY